MHASATLFGAFVSVAATSTLKLDKITIPTTGELITLSNRKLSVPDRPIIPFSEGDGVGPDSGAAASRVFEHAVSKAYGGRRKIAWFEVFAGHHFVATHVCRSTPEAEEWLRSTAKGG